MVKCVRLWFTNAVFNFNIETYHIKIDTGLMLLPVLVFMNYYIITFRINIFI